MHFLLGSHDSRSSHSHRSRSREAHPRQLVIQSGDSLASSSLAKRGRESQSKDLS
jgi:hypothetical protein